MHKVFKKVNEALVSPFAGDEMLWGAARHLSLFSGTGGLDIAAMWAGMETVVAAWVEAMQFGRQRVKAVVLPWI